MYLHPKTCHRCQISKPLFDFYENVSACKTCHKEYAKLWKAQNKEKCKKIDRRYSLKKYYGLTESDYKLLLDYQNGVCGICGQTDRKETLAVDHCHSSGKVRGLLCSKCNLGIGNFSDNISYLEAAIEYLKKYK